MRLLLLLIMIACNPSGPAAQLGPELCNGRDDDGDGAVDEEPTDATTWYADADGDGFGDPLAAEIACVRPAAHVSDATDCDDTAALAYPGAPDTAGVCGDGIGDCDAPCRYDGALPLNELRAGLYHGSAEDGLGGNDLAPVGDVTGDDVPDVWFGQKLLAPDAWRAGVHPDTEAVVGRLRGKEEGDQIYRIASVGDATGDGRPDVLALVFGGSRSDAFLIDAEQHGEVDVYEVGRRLAPSEDVYWISGAGDVDDDGVADVLLGDGITGDVWISYGYDLDSHVPIEVDIGPRGLHGLGDVDGDGRDDFGVSAGTADANGWSVSESVYVFVDPPRGSASVDDAGAELRQVGDWIPTGISVDAAGDTDGDGYPDLLVGYVTRRGSESEGVDEQLKAAALVLGPIDGDRDLDSAEAQFLVEIGYEANFSDIGAVVRGAGDMDADGLDDFAIGCEVEAAVYLYYGARLGMQPLLRADARLVSSGGDLGAAFDTLGDADGDGHSDLFLRDGGYEGDNPVWGEPDWGALYVLFGQAP